MLTNEHSQSQLSAFINERVCDVNRAVGISQRAAINM